MALHDIGKLGDLLESTRIAARIPGLAVAVVAGTQTIYAKGFGSCDLEASRPMTADTIYPIASTAKAINATLLGILVDEGKLAWDVPVQEYLPRFRLQDPLRSLSITIRDLVAMRTGLPLHEFVWVENPIARAELVERLAYLQLSAGLRERFQYSDLTPTIAGHIAEVVTGQTWEELVRERIFEPLQMTRTGFDLPAATMATLAYHESRDRCLLPTPRSVEHLIAPAGGSIHSTVNDMARWIAFNLSGGYAQGRPLLGIDTLRHLHTGHIVMGADPAAPSPHASYGFGWFVDTYNGRPRVSHTGHLYDVNSCVTLHPADGLGVVSFTNFASARLAQLINQYVFDIIMEFNPAQTFEQALQRYEDRIASLRERNASVPRVPQTSPSHALGDYAGTFEHGGYGSIAIQCRDNTLSFERNNLVVPLEHWHYDAWIAAPNDSFEIHKPHAFDHTSQFVFHTGAAGDIEALSVRFEPAVDPIRFRRHSADATLSKYPELSLKPR